MKETIYFSHSHRLIGKVNGCNVGCEQHLKTRDTLHQMSQETEAKIAIVTVKCHKQPTELCRIRIEKK